MKYLLPEYNVSLRFKIILLVLFFVLHKFPYASSKPHHNKSHGDTLIIGEFVKPSVINPILTHSTISAVLKDIIFDGLIRINEQMEPEPQVALSWKSSENGLSWTFYLRKDVRFHDGTGLTAEDVKFTFDKIMDSSINSPYLTIFRNFKSIRARDKYIVEIDLKIPLSSLLSYLDVGILPKHLLMGKDLRKTEFNYRPVGAGPFKIESWPHDEIILKANEDYFEGKPYLSKVIVRFFKDERMAWAELMKGNVDCVFLSSARSYNIIKEVPEFKVYSFLNPYYYILALNENTTFFRHRKIRQSLNYAINKEKILKIVLYGKGRISSGTVYPLSWTYDSEISPYPYEPKKALELLKEAGWQDTNGNYTLDNNGKELEFTLLIVEGDDIYQKCALLIQEQLLDIGIRMKVRSLPFSTMYEKFLSNKKFDAFLLPIVSNDPDKNYASWHSSQIDHGFNVFSYRNKKIDELLDKGRTTLDREERKVIYQQFQREIYEDPPGVFLFWRDYLIGIHKRFKGVRLNPVRILSNINEWYVPKEEQKYK